MEHKKILDKELNKLDGEIISMIVNRPYSSEAKHFNRHVHSITQERMVEEYYV